MVRYRFMIHILILMMSCVVHTSLDLEKNPLRILFVIDKFPWYTKSIIVNQIVGLLDIGHDVRIYARTKKMSDKIDPVVLKYDLLSRVYYESFPSDLDKYDIIICQYGDEGKRFVSVKRALNLKAKLVTCIRGGDITNVHNIKDGSYDELFQYGDLFLPVCEYFKSRLIALGCRPGKIRVLHSAIDCEGFPFRERTIRPGEMLRIVSVGRLHKEKAHAYVLHALAQVLKRIPNLNFEYCIVGDGPERKSLERLARKLRIYEQVKFLGWMNQEGVTNVLNSTHISILSSITAARGSQEGIPNALKEAMAMGIPVISTYHSGIPELVDHGISGLLTPERDVSAIADCIEYLVKHPEEWGKMGIAGRKKVEKEFEKNKINKRFFATLTMLFNKGYIESDEE